MKTIGLTRTFALGFLISLLSLSTTIDVFAQSLETQALIDQLLSVEKNRRTRWFPRAELAREIARDENISPKNRVEALKAVLREELENPCPITHFIHGGYATPTVYIQKQYVFGLEDVGAKAIPHLRKRLIQLKLSVQNISPSLGNTDSVDVVEMQHILCALGLLSDKESFEDVLKILEDEDGDGFMRQMAARALGKLQIKAVIPGLKRALKDDFHVIYYAHSGIPGERKVIYPVRSAAYSALVAFGFEFDLINDRQQWEYRIVKEP